MKRIDLQLFAQTTSIVDYLKSQGQDSSYSARKELASSLGITNYKGTATQNTQMLNTLRNNASSGTNSTSGSANGINGVDQSTMDILNSKFQGGSILGSGVYDTLGGSFKQSQTVTDAMNYTSQLLQKLNTGKTSYSDQVDKLMQEILNRDKFEYDVDKDTLFQQALASAMNAGKSAMQDTIGQASALTGGYGSSYATSAANQAYNEFIEDAYNNLPEYYEMAMQA
jgi:hypothetical protein